MVTKGSSKSKNWHDNVYFGLHYDLHAQKSDTELGASVTHDMLRKTWEKVKPDWVQCDCKGHAGYTSYPTKVGYPSPGIVRDALRIHREVTEELGIPLVMHYSGIRDDVAMENHPEWKRINVDGTSESGCACPRSGYVTDMIIPQFIELIDEYDVDGFWVDGDIWATKPCYCERCTSVFVSENGTNGRNLPVSSKDPGWMEWLAFHRRSYDEYVRTYVEAVHQRKPGCLVCTNWMYSMRHPDELTVKVDFLSGDFSSIWGLERATAEARFLDSRGMTWDLMAWSKAISGGGSFEAKPVAHLCQEASEVIANSGAFCLYVNPQRDGHLVEWHHEIVDEVAQFVRARQTVSQGSKSIPEAVVLHGSTHFYANNEPLYGLGEKKQPRMAHPVEGAMHALLDSGLHVDIQNEHGLLNRLEEYSLVVIPEQDPLSDEVAAALPDYVKHGGNLVLSGIHVSRHPVLSSLAGVTPDGEPLGMGEQTEPPTNNHFLSVDDEATNIVSAWQPVKLTEAQSWSPLFSGQQGVPRPSSETSAITLRKVGNGNVAAIHGPIFDAYYSSRYPRMRGLLQGLFRQMWKTPKVEIDAPGRVAVTLRTLGNSTVVHLLNRAADPPTSPYNVLVERVPSVGPVVVRLRMSVEPASVSLEPQEGAELQWNWNDGILTAHVSQLGIHSALVVDTK